MHGRKRAIWLEQAAIGLILLIGLSVRVHHLGFPELAGDEGFSYVFIQRPYAALITDTLAMGEPHPLASYFIFKAWSDLAGISEFALRFPSAWFGVLAIGLAYRLGCELKLSHAARLGAAALTALGPFSAFYSREMRMYGMLLALTMASTLLMWVFVRRFSWRVAAAYVPVSWLALHTHYYASFVLLAQTLFVLGSALLLRMRPSLRMLAGWTAAQIGVLIASLPWLIPALGIATSYGGAVDRSPDLVSAIFVYLSSFIGGQHFPLQEALPAIVCLCLALIAAGLVRLWLSGADGRLASGLLAIYLFVPLLLAWANGLNRPLFSQRYAISALGPLYLVVAAAAWEGLRGPQATAAHMLPRLGRVALAGAGLLIVAATLAGLRAYLRSEKVDGHPLIWHRFIDVINQYAESLPAHSVRVALNYPDPVYTYYHHRYLSQGLAFATLPPRAQDAEGARAVAREWRAQDSERVLLQIVDSFWDGQGVAASALASEFAYLGDTYTGQWIVKIYGRPGPGDLQPLNVQFVNGPRLSAAYARVNLTTRLLEIYLSWDAAGAMLRGSEKFFVHVSEADNPFVLIGQRDEPLTLNSPQAIQMGGFTVHGYGLALHESPPIGRYHVRIGLYDPGRPGMPRLLTSSGHDAVVIATFTVE